MIVGRHRALPVPWQSRRARVAALVPLVVLSTTSAAGIVGSVADGPPEELRKVAHLAASAVPDRALAVPASYGRPAGVTLGRANSSRGEVRPASATTSSIPPAALVAYQRASTVIDAADRTCHLPWQVIAAIGLVESDHGRYGGNVVDADGVSRPGVYGVALNGRHRTQVIRDTDAGDYDDDPNFDRAVGPMQFIPSTWTAVAVDADGDSRRNPQDIDDAALAAAIYLCSGPGDLATDRARRTAVYRYNHSQDYVRTVLSIMDAYRDGEYASAATYSMAPFAASPGSSSSTRHGAPLQSSSAAHTDAMSHTADSAVDSGGHHSSPAPTKEPSTPTPNGHPASPDPDATEETVQAASAVVTSVLTLPEAVVSCTSLGLSAILTPTQWQACLTDLQGS